jgi:hypothetical protein
MVAPIILAPSDRIIVSRIRTEIEAERAKNHLQAKAFPTSLNM